MSFGFSVSDIYVCARLAYKLYDEFKQAPGVCQEFARDLLLFHQVLLKTNSNIECEASYLSHFDHAALRACLDSCKDLLYVQILGAPVVPQNLKEAVSRENGLESTFLSHDRDDLFHWYSVNWRIKITARKFALRIPKLQRAISSHIEKLTALNVLLIQSRQKKNEDSQERIEECIAEFDGLLEKIPADQALYHDSISERLDKSHDFLTHSSTDQALQLDSVSKRIDTSHDLLTNASTDQALQLNSISERLDTSQARIESQLQAILANQQRSKTPVLSQTLDASSPEGRQTWMELGRLLRDEGITPAMIQDHRELLIDAMKTTLRNETSLAESTPESFVTAPEYDTYNNTSSSVTRPRDLSHPGRSSILSPISILGSAPPSSPFFTNAFLERHHGAASSLDRRQNVDEGMQSLVQGMNQDDPIPELHPGYEKPKFEDLEELLV